MIVPSGRPATSASAAAAGSIRSPFEAGGLAVAASARSFFAASMRASASAQRSLTIAVIARIVGEIPPCRATSAG